jgi:phosphoenolpyruvate-protein phosphotransferase (PTS system enzyme I)
MLSTEPDAPPEPPALEPEAPRPTTPPKKLTAISRAARETRANVQVMAPDDLHRRGGGVRGPRICRRLRRAGIMIEGPAAPLIAWHIVPRVHFVRVGTNDLTQYTYAADRMHGGVAELNDHWQPAVSRLIGMSAAQGRAPDARWGLR